MNRKHIIFLDLELTVIHSWEDPVVLMHNIERMREGIPANAEIGLMSWAVWNNKDKDKFNNTLRSEIEEALGHKFSDKFVWSMDDWCAELAKNSVKKLNREDLFDCFSKHEVLFMMSRCHPEFRNSNVVLIDDTVEHMLSWHSRSMNCHCITVNVAEI